jgi:NitT/TauT family transport system substrate-binding protein
MGLRAGNSVDMVLKAFGRDGDGGGLNMQTICNRVASMVRAAFFGLALSTTAAGAASAAEDKVIFAWPGAITTGIAPFAMAQEMGLFRKENINFNVVVLQGSGVIIPQLLNGSIFTAYATPDPLIISRQPDKPNFEIKFVYNAVRNSIWEIVVLDGSNVHTVKDLAQKKIGVGALTWGNVPMTKAILQQSGVGLNSVQFVAVGAGVPAFEAIRRGQIDALNLFDVQHAALAAQGTKIRLVPFPPQFAGVSSHGLPVTNKMIRERPDLVARFGRAVAEGTIACDANPDGCLRAYWKQFPDQKPEVTDTAAVARELSFVRTRLSNMIAFDSGEPHKYGVYKEKDWTTLIASLRLGEQLDNSQINISSLYTNEFASEYNRFDADEIVKAAKAY